MSRLGGITERTGEIARNLSGGMKRRLNMAVGLVHRPQVVLMDEPTVGVDPQSRNRIFEMIEGLRRRACRPSIRPITSRKRNGSAIESRSSTTGESSPWARRMNLCATQVACASEVAVRFRAAGDGVAEWVTRQGGRYDAGKAQFTVERASEIGGLLDAAAKAGHELANVWLRKPNLESVFLQLTGRELRD